VKETKKIKILVTGAAGFIGSHLTDELLKKYQVIGLDNLRNGKKENLKQAFKNSDFNFIEEDILDPSICIKNLKGIDVVYHLACLGVRHSLHSPFENHRVNAEGTLNILEAALKNSVKKIFYISTSEIYGDVKTFPIKESDIPLPKTVYGASKLAGENYAYSYFKTYGLNTTILRIFNNYGPRAHYEGDAGEVIPRTIVNLLYNQAPIIFGDGSITRDFFYVKDTAKVLSQLLSCKNLEGEIINIGTGVEITLKSLLEKILTLMNKQNELQIKYMESRPADVPRLWVNAEKFKGVTNFKSNYNFEEGLIETINYYKNLMQTKNLIEEMKIKNWEKA
jgi:UDP-glucose 4-epimerase